MTHRERATKIILDLQEKKKPLDVERVALWTELSELLATVVVREAELRTRIKEIQARVTPIDAAMCEANEYGNIKHANAANRMIDGLEEEINGITD